MGAGIGGIVGGLGAVDATVGGTIGGVKGGCTTGDRGMSRCGRGAAVSPLQGATAGGLCVMVSGG
jgi:hypothetical protein